MEPDEPAVNKGTHLTVDMIVAAYVKLRDEIREREEGIQELKGKLDKLGNKLLELCEAQDMTGFKTPAGTVSRRIRQTYWTSDWDSMYKFIKEHDAPFLLEKRIHSGNMREFLAENKDECPIGLQSKSEYYISIRKPNAGSKGE